jgi:MFS family permease
MIKSELLQFLRLLRARLTHSLQLDTQLALSTSTPGMEDATSNLDTPPNDQEPKGNKGLRFWLVFLVLCLAGFVASMDATIIFTALPTISDDVNGQKEHTWVGNAYVVTSTALQPLYGQLSNIFGRRNPMIASVSLFALGSGIAGGASNAATFISRRLVQGLGAGGMVMLIDLIVCNLLPLRERSQYLSAVLGACAVGTLIGPVLGGAIVTHATWRWAFWINLPMCVLTLAIMVPFLRLSWKTFPSWTHAVSRIDFVGNFIFVGAIASMLLGLIQGGALYPWNSWRIILPLVLGVVGWAVFFLQQSYCSEPTMPLHLFRP